MNKILIIALIPVFVFSQDVEIKQLSDNINTNNAEINFIQINDSSALFTVVRKVNNTLESNIYTAELVGGNWKRKKFAEYNSKNFNTANISFLDSTKIFLSICNKEMQECKIVFYDQNKNSRFNDITSLSSESFFNTQANVCKHGSQSVLYFSSDRKGGFGGLDIWLLVIDSNGNFGTPINAGSNINSLSDEITPFYNQYNRMMYFSSNRKNGVGGFDVYTAEGSLNRWKRPKNVESINSNKDDLYLTFYDENTGYFSSNRDGAKFINEEYCCNDIFSFRYLNKRLDTIKQLSGIQNLLPLSLYFHNDEPDSNTMSRTTKKTYKEAYISYFKMQSEYERQNPNTNKFFESVLQKNFNTLNKLLDRLFFDITNGSNVELLIKGYASPLYSLSYNQNLSQRRILSFKNYLMQYNNGILKEHIYSRKLKITELPFGESNASHKVSDDSNDQKNSVYSIEAMLERKIEIVKVILQD